MQRLGAFRLVVTIAFFGHVIALYSSAAEELRSKLSSGLTEPKAVLRVADASGTVGASADPSPHGVWLGSYTCGHGTFSFELVISIAPKRPGQSARDVHAVVSFDFSVGGPAKRASVVMSGEYGPKMQRLRLNHLEEYIERPAELSNVLGYEGAFEPSARQLDLSFRGSRHKCEILAVSEASNPTMRADALQILGRYASPPPSVESHASDPVSASTEPAGAPLGLTPSVISAARKNQGEGGASTTTEALIAQVESPDIRLYVQEPDKPLCTGKLVDVVLRLVTKNPEVIEQFDAGRLDGAIVQMAPDYLGDPLKEGCKTEHAYVLGVLEGASEGTKLRIAPYRAIPNEQGTYLWRRQPFKGSRYIPSELRETTDGGAAVSICKAAFQGGQLPDALGKCMRAARELGYPEPYLSFDLLAELKDMDRRGLPGCVEAQNLVNRGVERIARDFHMTASTKRFGCAGSLKMLSRAIDRPEEELQSHLRCIGFGMKELQSRELFLQHFTTCMDVRNGSRIRRALGEVAKSCHSDADVPSKLFADYFRRALDGHEGWQNDFGSVMYERGIRDVEPEAFTCAEIAQLARANGIISETDFAESVARQEAAKAERLQVAEREREARIEACKTSGEKNRPPTSEDILTAANAELLSRCGNPQAVARLLQGRFPPETATRVAFSLLLGARLKVEDGRCAITALGSSSRIRYLTFGDVNCQSSAGNTYVCTGRPRLDCSSESDIAFGSDGLPSQGLECKIYENLPSTEVALSIRHENDCTWRIVDLD